METLLLVEDEALIAMDEQVMLESHGFSVIPVYKAGDAIEAVNRNDIDLILMDIDLGSDQMDGTDVARIILDNLPIGLAVNNSEEGHANYVNKQFEYIYGWPKEDLTDLDHFF